MCETCCLVKRDTMIARHNEKHKHRHCRRAIVYIEKRRYPLIFVYLFVCLQPTFAPFFNHLSSLHFRFESLSLTHSRFSFLFTQSLTHLLLLLLMFYYIYPVLCAVYGALDMHILYIYMSQCVQHSLPVNGQ